MKKNKLIKFLSFCLCLPVYSLIGGIPTEGGAADNTDDGDEAGIDANENKDDKKDEDKKTFTQEEVNAIMSKEKKQGKIAVLKDLGFKDLEDAKKFINSNRKVETKKEKEVDNDKKDNDELDTERTARIKAQNDILNLNRKFSLINNDANKENVEDLLILLNAKLDDDSDDNDIKVAIDELKVKYPSSFIVKEDDKKDEKDKKGTGTNIVKKKVASGTLEGIGERLAKNIKTGPSKSSYFKN